MLLSGGVDIYPEIYCDWDTVETKGTYNPERDGFELKVLEKAIQRKIPILGICRGLELVNVYFRGSLIFDLEEIRGVNHKRISPAEDRFHEIRIFRDTLLHEILNLDNATVNSSHHQSIDRLGEGLMINSKSDDGIVEGIEYADKTDKPFFIGVQWHPERFSDFNSPVSKNILDRFISECNKF
ncbi:MAG: gamma-glutamyl-gamma-aminobutyrate hydrolase family protein [Ignavibacteria bacterium]|nr:gamma-glutamyl-gamma-aminobutyrate hydrolase family protein [Ignavibacteria bacterium]